MSSGSITGTSQAGHHWRLSELELSDDGSSSAVSETEHEQQQSSGRHRLSANKQWRGGPSITSQISPASSSGLQRPHGSPLPNYPVSIRQQLAIIKQMEQPIQAVADPSSCANSQLTRTSSVSPGISRKRIPKVHKKNERGETPLHVAARKGEYQQCRKLIQEGAEINARDYAGWTPLHEACYRGHFRVAKLLISHEADVNALSDCDDTPLHDAVASGNEKLVWLLLHSGAIRDRTDSDGKRPIDICRPECKGIRNLFMAVTIPDQCPVEESSSLSPSVSSHAQHPPSPPLAVNIATQFSKEKPSVISPSSNDIMVTSETYLGEESVDVNEKQRLQRRGSYEQPLDREQIIGEETKIADADDLTSMSEGRKSDIHFDGGNPSLVICSHSIWQEESSNTMQIEESYIDSSAYEYDDDLASSRGSQDSTRFGLNESKEADIRSRVGRPRGMTHTENFSPQHIPQKSINGERRKQRGRRRGRGISTALGPSAVGIHTSQCDDVYEFRSSPESDIDINKTGCTNEIEREMSGSPSSKRQRFSEASAIPVDTATTTMLLSQTSGFVHSGISVVEKEISDSSPCEQVDDKNDVTVDRKVPPLRISLPRTPSEDGATIGGVTDEAVSITVNVGRRNTRTNKGHNKKHQSPEQTGSNVSDESVQRITRSKLRQTGRQLRDQLALSYDTSAKKKSGTSRRGSIPTASPMPAPSVAASDDQTNSSNDAGDRVDVEEGAQLEMTASKDDENASLALSLMKKNSYEGFRGFRSLIEERWAIDATEETIPPEYPSNYDNYMIVQKNYTTKNNLHFLPPVENPDVVIIENLTAKLRDLHTNQQEKRRNMLIYQQVERERLQMQAESEVLRMLMRKSNEGRRGSFSAMRIIRETDLFNTGFLEVKQKELPVMEISELKTKYEKLAETMRRRQQIEADALYAEQVFVWNAAIQRSEDATLFDLKNAVPRVPVIPLILNL